MATKTLKTGDLISIKETGKSGIITHIENGVYCIDNEPVVYRAYQIQAVKIKPEQKKKTPIKKTSANRATLNLIYAIISREYMAHNKICTARFAGCTHRATSIHHRFKRTGWHLIMTNLFLPICRNCHRYATDHSKEAIEAGVSISRYTDVPVTFTKREQELLKKYNVKTP